MGAAQGKKVDPAPLRLRRSRRSRPRARSSQREAVWLAPLRTVSSGEDLADIAGSAQGARQGRRRERNPGVEKGGWSPRSNSASRLPASVAGQPSQDALPGSRAIPRSGGACSRPLTLSGGPFELPERGGGSTLGARSRQQRLGRIRRRRLGRPKRVCRERHSSPGRAADKKRADNGECLAPAV